MTDKTIKLAHGGGGLLMGQLLRHDIMPALQNPQLLDMTDSAELQADQTRLAFTTDSFVVRPLFFPGGDIGRVAVCGTVNDLAAAGAKPLALSLAIIVEEGFPIPDLRRIVASAAAAAQEADVRIVTGDTKVIEYTRGQEIFLTTSGVGAIPDGIHLAVNNIQPGDAIIINGTIGDHGMAVMSAREGLDIVSAVESDVAPLASMVSQVLAKAPPHAVRCMKDPTRGGLAACLNELASRTGFVLDHRAIPVRPAVQGACELLGIDPLTVANEGKMVFVVARDAAQDVLSQIRSHPLGREAAIIGCADDRPGLVRLTTPIAGERIIDVPYGEELPRIC